MRLRILSSLSVAPVRSVITVPAKNTEIFTPPLEAQLDRTHLFRLDTTPRHTHTQDEQDGFRKI
jgi:hypothetical protein